MAAGLGSFTTLGYGAVSAVLRIQPGIGVTGEQREQLAGDGTDGAVADRAHRRDLVIGFTKEVALVRKISRALAQFGLRNAAFFRGQ